MHILVTDSLTCVRCGPDFGLILLADVIRERRVIEGWLGCSNCRERYPIVGGYGDLRPSPRTPEPTQSRAQEPTEPRAPDPTKPRPPEPTEGADLSDDPAGALKLAALLGVTEGPGLILLLNSSVGLADRMAAMVPGVEMIAVDPAIKMATESTGVTRLGISDRLPFRSGSLRGVVLEGGRGEALLQEGIRVLGQESRIIFLDPPIGGKERVSGAGCELLMEADSVLVGVRK